MSLKIIGPGFGRTGTHSLKCALEHLGLGPCHHMWEVRDNPAQLIAWEAAARGETMDWPAIFDGYFSQVDWPGARYWRQLAEQFPDAKVILSIRSEGPWYESMMETVGPFMWNYASHPSERMRARAKMTFETVDQQIFAGKLKDRQAALAIFRQHIEDVQATIPARRLLTYEVAEGWEPLCNFLEVTKPSIAFPHTNSREYFLNDRPNDA